MDSYCLPSVEVVRLLGGRWIRPRRFFLGCLKASTWVALLVNACSVPETAWGYTPESPEVQQMLDKAIPFWRGTGGRTFGVGADCLVALALLKAGKEQDHPLVQQAIANVAKVGRNGCADKALPITVTTRRSRAFFLCEWIRRQYASEISMLLQAMVKRQRPNGALGYEPYTYDDTSQTQYGVLCLLGGASSRACRCLLEASRPPCSG